MKDDSIQKTPDKHIGTYQDLKQFKNSELRAFAEEVKREIKEILPEENNLTVKGFDQPTMSFWAGRNSYRNEVIKDIQSKLDELIK